MDPDKPSSTPRKVKFAPKAPRPRKPKLAPTKTEVGGEEDAESSQAQTLLRRFNENLARREPKVERKSSVHVAFGPVGSSSAYLRTYDVSKDVNGSKSSGSSTKVFADEQSSFKFPATAIEESDACIIDATDDTTNASARKTKTGYKEPWDSQSYYPTVLPLRKPDSGDPEILDEEEFGDAAASVEYDENAINAAEELGLLDKSEEEKMLFFQLPPLPMSKSGKGMEKVGTSTESGGSIKCCSLKELPGGYVGKMQIYKSGAIKLKIGEILYDVSPGMNVKFAQDVVVMNTAKKHCCVLGKVDKMAVVTPDLFSDELERDFRLNI